MNPETNKTLYELHGSFHVINVDISRWIDGQANITGKMGLYYDKELVDWYTLQLFYNKAENKVTWDCDDGHSSIDQINEIKQDFRINCFVNESSIQGEIFGDKAYF